MDKVGIVGFYTIKPELDINMSPYEMIFTAVRGALDGAGLKRDDLTTVVSATNDYYDGKTISNCFKVEAGGAYMKDESKVEMDGAHAAYYALFRILSQNHKLALTYGFSMCSCMPYESARVYETDPTWDRPINVLNGYTTQGMQMRAYMKAHGVSEETIAKAASIARGNAAKNPLALAEAQASVSVDDVMKSEYISSPLRGLMYPMECDGMSAMILAPEKQALKITDKPVWIRGVGMNQDTYYLGDRDLTKSVSMEAAAKKAYSLAGIKDPKSEIDVAEIFGHSACEDLILAEAAGLADAGKGIDAYESGKLNPSGGALSGYNPCTCGTTRLIEAAKQLRGEAGGHQVDGAKIAIATGQIGFCAQNNIIYVLEAGGS